MSPEVQRPLPPYLQIVEHFRDLISRGELRDGDRLPSARDIVGQWNVAHATAAKVIATLRSEGLVQTLPGAGGTIVSVHGVEYAPNARMAAVRRWGKIYPPDEHARIVSAELVDAPAEVAESLRLDTGTPVIRRHRITYRGEAPVSVSTSWFDGRLAEAAPDLLRTERIQLGTPGYIERQTGRRMARGRDQVAAGNAEAEVAAELGVAEGATVHRGRNWTFDADGEVIEFGEYVAIANRWATYDYDLT